MMNLDHEHYIDLVQRNSQLANQEFTKLVRRHVPVVSSSELIEEMMQGSVCLVRSAEFSLDGT